MFRVMSIIILMLHTLGCTKTDKLNADDLKWNPYKGGEVLVFNSNQGDTDTIFVKSIEKAKAVNDNLAIFPKHHEILNVSVQHTDPTPPNRAQGYSEDFFFDLYATNDKNTIISFDLMAKNAWFYADSYYKNELEKLPITTLSSKNFTYTDVIKLEPQSQEFYERDEFVTVVYWSKSKGYIRYDLKNGVYWELQ